MQDALHLAFFISALLKLPFHLVAVIIVPTNDDVIIKRYPHCIACTLHALSESIVLNTGPRIVARMIMSQDYTVCKMSNSVLEYDFLVANSCRRPSRTYQDSGFNMLCTVKH